jgi:predicted  nucleic acid-binding Zn-ribbon protein
MVEPIMYVAIGFLVATLIAIGVMPLVHARAVRLTTKRLEAATPLSMAEIQADKDRLRAEFAMSARRLEMSVDQLKSKTTSQLAELGKKSDAINRMKFELSEKNAAIFALEAREKSVKERLAATEEEFAQKTESLRNAEAQLAARQNELAGLGKELTDRSSLAESRQIELAALSAQIAQLQQRVNDAEREYSDTQQKLALQRDESATATRDLNVARERADTLDQRVQELEQRLATQTEEARVLAARASELENRLAAQGEMLTERGLENHQLRLQLEAANAAIASAGEKAAGAAIEKLRGEKTELEQQLTRAVEERGNIQRELAAIHQQAEASWASERMENAVLRERINDMAAEVAKLAGALEGIESPIDGILATEAAAPIPSEPSSPALAGPAAVADAGAPQLVPDAAAEPLPRKGTLADRIRALQAHASRAQQAG